MASDLDTFLAKLVDLGNGNTVNEADAYFVDLMSNSPVKALHLCVTAIHKEEIPVQSVMRALIIIKKMFTPKASVPINVLRLKWREFHPDAQNDIKKSIYRSLSYDQQIIRNNAAVALALVSQLNWNASEQEKTMRALAHSFAPDRGFTDAHRIGCLKALHELVEYHLVTSKTPAMNECAPVFADYMRQCIVSQDARLSPHLTEVVGLFNGLFVVIGEHVGPGNQNALMEMVMTKIGCSERTLQNALYNLTLSLVKRFYSAGFESEEVLNKVVVIGMAQFRRQGVEPEACEAPLLFWSKLARFEKIVREEKRVKYVGIVEKTGVQLLPVVMSLIQVIVHEEPILEDFNEVNIQMCAASLLKEMIILAPNETKTRILNAAVEMVGNSDWKSRASGLVIFYCFIASRVFSCDIMKFLSLVADPSPIVVDNALWIIEEVIIAEPNVVVNIENVQRLLLSVGSLVSRNESILCKSMSVIRTMADSWAKCSMTSLKSDVWYDVVIQTMRFLVKRLDDAEEAAFPYIGNVTSAFVSVIKSAPTSPVILQEIFAVFGRFIERLQAHGATMSSGGSTEHLLRNMNNYCVLIWAVSDTVGGSLEQSPALTNAAIELLLRCIENNDLFEEALAAVSVMLQKVPGANPEATKRVMQRILVALDSRSPEMIKESAVCLWGLLKHCSSVTVPYIAELMKRFIAVITEENMLISAKTPVIRSLGLITRNFPTMDGSKLLQVMKQLNALCAPPLSTESDEAANFCSVIVYGYHSVLLRCAEADFVTEFVNDYRIVSSFFEKMARDLPVMTRQLVCTIVNYLRDLKQISSGNIGKRLNVFLSKQCIKNILLCAVNNFRNEDAKILLRDIFRIKL